MPRRRVDPPEPIDERSPLAQQRAFIARARSIAIGEEVSAALAELRSAQEESDAFWRAHDEAEGQRWAS